MQTHPTTLNDWLSVLETRHPKTIDLGLERVAAVKDRLGIQFNCPVITVAGTNGKGSTCAMLDSMLSQAGFRAGLYMSPHILDFNERARIGGDPVSDADLVASFEAVEAARGDISLTYFEFTTLAILRVFAATKLDAVILEVGMGGRLDAVNVIDADVAVVTSVDIDHTEYLGKTREEIALEKAGIFRAGKTAICSDPIPPESLIKHAEAIGADLWLFGRDFNYVGDKQQWNYGGRTHRRGALNYPTLRGANQLLNASAAMAALESLRDRLPVSAQEVRNGLVLVDLPARFQVLAGMPTVVLDVAHNPHAAATMGLSIDAMGFHKYTYAVFGAMKDKDIAGMIEQVKGRIDHWCVTDLPSPRAASAELLKEKVIEGGALEPDKRCAERTVQTFASPAEAFANAMSRAVPESDRIVVFGSFVTVAGVMPAVRGSKNME
ncbi:MAG TPA: bifunctional tetrahydrofolate synthase/dihydrofolate synthase [Burkholderiaceae bacterium]|jgi:dihydrofolate synthase/folylpolyglutamate synthase|nr:bifunctional tetrahydrofolate synthase/dihydrofolate synthase [Burkholderiaceae bacterium]